jgi:hypothetical protein
MSNLAQYRVSIGLFSLGLLWAVSAVVGEGDKPGPLDSATKSIVHRLNSVDHGEERRSHSPFDLAVSETSAPPPEASGEASAEPAAPGSAAIDGSVDRAAPQAQAEPGAAEPQLAPPDAALIHK